MIIIPPRRNLGCLGFSFGQDFYFDFYRSPHLGMFIQLKGRRIWLHLNGFKAELKKTDIIFRIRIHSLYVSRKHLLIH